MAKKSVKLKKKGPKGKRARAKAKLERQWGEEEVKDNASDALRGRDLKRRPRDKQQGQQEADTTEERYDRFLRKDGSDDDDDEQEKVDAKAVSSFVEQLRKRHFQKEKKLMSPSPQTILASQAMELENDDESISNHDSVDSEEEDQDQDMEHVDPFTARFAVSFSDSVPSSSSNLNNPQDGTSNKAIQPRKVPLSFAEEGTVLQLSKWPPTEMPLPPALPHDRKEWRQCARRLWQTQKPLLRQNSLPTSPVAQVLYPLLATYMDICQTIPEKHNTLEGLYASHIVNHVWTSRQRIYQHSKELRELDKDLDHDDHDAAADLLQTKQDPKFRDQGFTRPTVLVLLPTRGICYKFVQTLLDLLCGDDDTARATALGSRFVTEYGPPEELDMDPRRQTVLQQKGEEWNSLFGDDVNDDDDFKLGVALHLHEKKKRPSLKLYTDFSKSDLILASPLGLKMWKAKGRGVDDNDDGMDEEVEVSAPDFLSSIEICWVSHAHILMMQNWDHVTDVLSWLNQRPKETTDTDFARIRPYFLEDNDSSSAWRQMILTAPYLEPELKAVFGRYAQSRTGSVRLARKTPWLEAALTQIAVPTRQVFQRIVVSSVREQADARLEYFAKNVLPKIDRDQQPFTLIFVPSYLEFVSLRNFLLKREADYFVSVTEYSRHTEVSRGRARFGQGRKALMLYTGRAHFFHRHIIRGVRHVIWYGLPSDPTVYRQVVDWCQDETTQTQESKTVPESSVLALYTAYEAHALERIVGHSHCSRMTKGIKTTFLFAA